ncbi:MAG: DUF3656 domain-containing protein [Acutalibacteraceae bacterium]|nr:DUF3656 domain-containing protein [Acutalibacteraceae bacterium]
MKSFEILAPAGSMEALIAAVRSGANAVYIGTTQFGARASAKNFDSEALKEAVEFCHDRGVKLYLTMNTLITDNELPTALSIAQYAYELKIDAIIVQDVGFGALLHKSMPDLHLHGSTQMSIHTPQGAKLLYELGFTRVVLAREMTKSEIAEVAKACPIELEVFVHGALCMSVSGQCYFSSLLGSRSGNRGQCAQTCRLPFMVENGTGNDLSLKDMSILENLRELSDIGVISAKIEGRLKRPEYVASAVNVARQYYDYGTASEESCNQLKSVFSRSGFTDGYYTGNRGAVMFGTRQKDDVIAATPKILNQIHSIYKNEYQHIGIDMQITLAENTPAKLVVTAENGEAVTVFSAEPVQAAINKPLDTERVSVQLSKTGGTPYLVNNVACEIDDNVTVPMSVLNNLRREALAQLTTKLADREIAPLKAVTPAQTHTRSHKENVPLRAVFTDWDIPEEFAECELVFIPENTPADKIRELSAQGFKLGIEIFAGMFSREDQIRANLKKAKENGITHALVNNLGAIPLCKELGFSIHGGFRLNVMNSESVSFFENLGIEDLTASFELTLQQINALGGNAKIGAIIYGKLPLMLTRNCPGVNSASSGCAECGKLGYITDRKEISFPYKCSGGCTQLYNSVPLYMGDRLREITSTDFNIMLFTTETTEEKLYALSCVKAKSKIEGGHTRGLYYKGVL